MERLEAEKRLLQEKLDQPVSAPMSPRSLPTTSNSNPPGSLIGTTLNLGLGLGSSEQASNLTEHIINLRREVSRLKANLEKTERDHKENIAKIVKEEKTIREENIRLQRRLQMEVDRREALCRHLSESESSLEMDDERHFNESSRVRTISSPVPGYVVNSSMRGESGTTTTAMITNQNNSINSTSQPVNNSIFSQPLSHQLAASAANLVGGQQERCLSCNQLKPVNLNTSNSILNSASPPPMPLTGNNSRQQQMSIGGGGSGFNALTASSSLSSSSSSINSSNFNKIPQLNQIITTPNNLTNAMSTTTTTTNNTSNMEFSKKL